MDEYQIVERVKDGYRTGSIKAYRNFLLNDRTIISYETYKHSYQHNPSISKQVIGYVDNDDSAIYVYTLEFPLLRREFVSSAYLYKKGYVITEDSPFGPAPLPNLKYFIYCVTSDIQYEFQDRLVIELVDLDVVANNLNLPKIMSSVLGPKLLSQNNIIEYFEIYEIEKQVLSQELFAGNTWEDAKDIVYRYFDGKERELSKEVLKISAAYQQIFRPYRIVYNTKTWQPVLM